MVFDVLARLIRRLYPKLTYVRNITDVEDKINAAALEEGVPIEEITARTTQAFHDDMAALGAEAPDIEPRATAHIPQMIEMIEALIAKGHAYLADGHVLFEVASMPAYGAFAKRSPDEMLAGARVEVAPYKRDAMDFVLWKPSDAETPGWDSPWGRGRPGWHIECSAMSQHYLGTTFDIHGGGVDLVFPHHQNEIAQSACAHDGAPLAKYWMHNGYLMVEGEKMAKSLGNFLTVHDLLKTYRGEALRLTLLATQYRAPLDFTTEGVDRAKGTLDRWYRAVDDAEPAEEVPAAVIDALSDDLNTPLAIKEMHALADAALAGDKAAARDLRAAGEVMGLLGQSADAWAKGGAGDDAAEIEKLIAERKAAREAKDFARADEIRDDLAKQGILLEDGPGGTTWRRA